MRGTFISTAEKNFISKALRQDLRIDGRTRLEFRNLIITLGQERGCCLVELGNTKVFTNVSCELTSPKPGRPTDGLISVGLELSPMASPQFESGRFGSVGIEICRLLERCLKESRCLDTESLCIRSGEKVWSIKIDVTVLDHDGSIIDCASICAITALLHFRRPDVTVCGEEFTVHSPDERLPVPLNVHHIPICVTFGFVDQSLLLDPLDREERVLDGKIVYGINSHKELCALHAGGKMLMKKQHVLRCSSMAEARAKELTDLIKSAIARDLEARTKGGDYGLHRLLTRSLGKVTVTQATVSPKTPVTVNALPEPDTSAKLSNPGQMYAYTVVPVEPEILAESPLAQVPVKGEKSVHLGAPIEGMMNESRGANGKLPSSSSDSGPEEMEILRDDPIQIEVKQPRKNPRIAKNSSQASKTKGPPGALTLKNDSLDASPGLTAVEKRKARREQRKTGNKCKKGAPKDELLDDIEEDILVLEGTDIT